jgi:hypothetical protein
VPEARPGGDDRDGAGGDWLDFGDRHRRRGLGTDAPTQDGPAQEQNEPRTHQAVITARPRSGTWFAGAATRSCPTPPWL